MEDWTTPFTLTRWEVALASAGEYVRSLWWIIIGIPAFGLAALAFGGEFLRGFGAICLIWPLTIPLRAVTASARAGGLYGKPTVLAADADWIYLRREDGRGVRISRGTILSARLGGKIWRLKTNRLSVVLVPDDAVYKEYSLTLKNLGRNKS